MTDMRSEIRRRAVLAAAGPRAAIIALCCLAAACASTPGGRSSNDPQVLAARQSYEACLGRYVASADDNTSEVQDIGDVLASYCLREFTDYRALSGVAERVNQDTATQTVKSHRQH